MDEDLTIKNLLDLEKIEEKVNIKETIIANILPAFTLFFCIMAVVAHIKILQNLNDILPNKSD